MDIAGYYTSLQAHRHSLLEQCIADSETFSQHVASHSFLREVDVILKVVNGSERSIFLQAAREFQYSLEAVLCGSYRHAFLSLRLTLELFTAATYFSAHQMKLNLWMMGGDDLRWSTLNDPDKGVYSHNFTKAFNPDLGSYRSQYMNLATKVYHECSEYVHGNPSTHENTSEEVIYDRSKAQQFHDKVATIRICILFQFFVRYLGEMNKDHLKTVEFMAIDDFGHVPEIRQLFGENTK